MAMLRPLRGDVGMNWPFQAEGQSAEAAQRNPRLNVEVVTPTYFDTMRIRLLRGRTFTEQDDAKAQPVALVSRAMADRYWPGQDPVGKRFQMPMLDQPYPLKWVSVIGVAGDARFRELQEARFDVYIRSCRPSRVLHQVGAPAGEPLAYGCRHTDLPCRPPTPASCERVGHPVWLGGGPTPGRRALRRAALRRFALAGSSAALGIYALLAFVVGHGRARSACAWRWVSDRLRVGRLVVTQACVPCWSGGLGSRRLLLLSALWRRSSSASRRTTIHAGRVRDPAASVAMRPAGARAARGRPRSARALREE